MAAEKIIRRKVHSAYRTGLGWGMWSAQMEVCGHNVPLQAVKGGHCPATGRCRPCERVAAGLPPYSFSREK